MEGLCKRLAKRSIHSARGRKRAVDPFATDAFSITPEGAYTADYGFGANPGFGKRSIFSTYGKYGKRFDHQSNGKRSSDQEGGDAINGFRYNPSGYTGFGKDALLTYGLGTNWLGARRKRSTDPFATDAFSLTPLGAHNTGHGYGADSILGKRSIFSTFGKYGKRSVPSADSHKRSVDAFGTDAFSITPEGDHIGANSPFGKRSIFGTFGKYGKRSIHHSYGKRSSEQADGDALSGYRYNPSGYNGAIWIPDYGFGTEWIGTRLGKKSGDFGYGYTPESYTGYGYAKRFSDLNAALSYGYGDPYGYDAYGDYSGDYGKK